MNRSFGKDALWSERKGEFLYGVWEMPEFPLQALYWRGEKGTGAWAVLDEAGTVARVVAMNRRAREVGVRSGMTAPQAMARGGDGLRLWSREEEAEAALARMVLLRALSFTPIVEAGREGLWTLDLRGLRESRRAALADEWTDLSRELRKLGLWLRAGLARTPDHARWAAALGQPVKTVANPEALLAEVTPERTGMPPKIVAALRDWGVGTLAALRRMPRAAVVSRLGPEGAALLDRVEGRSPRLLEPTVLAPVYARTRFFEAPLETVESVAFALRRMVDELVLELEVGHRAAEGFDFILKQERGAPLERSLTLPEPTARGDTLFRVLAGLVEGVRAETPIIECRLLLHTREARYRQRELFAVAMEDTAGVAGLTDRLATLVGEEGVGAPRCADTWRPDAVDIGEPGQLAGVGADQWTPKALGLPLRRVRPPERAVVWEARDNGLGRGYLAAVRSGAGAVLGGDGGPVADCAGPYRRSGGWWTDEPWSREEWDVVLAESGARLRLFRERDGWWLEGCYA